jgi:hypothetical protein
MGLGETVWMNVDREQKNFCSAGKRAPAILAVADHLTDWRNLLYSEARTHIHMRSSMPIWHWCLFSTQPNLFLQTEIQARVL